LSQITGYIGMNLRNQSDVPHAKTIVTQFEFINYKYSLANLKLIEGYQKIFANDATTYLTPNDTTFNIAK